MLQRSSFPSSEDSGEPATSGCARAFLALQGGRCDGTHEDLVLYVS